MAVEDFMEEARQFAAQCWCDDETKHIVMDPVLAEAVARRVAVWMDTAAQNQRNADFYSEKRDEATTIMNRNANIAIKLWEELKRARATIVRPDVMMANSPGTYNVLNLAAKRIDKLLKELKEKAAESKVEMITVDEAVQDCRRLFNLPEKTEVEDGRPGDEGQPAQAAGAADSPDAEGAEPHTPDAEREGRED